MRKKAPRSSIVFKRTEPLTFHEIDVDNASTMMEVRLLCLPSPVRDPRQRASQRSGKLTNVPAQFGNDNFGFFAARYSASESLSQIEMASTI